MEPVELIPQPSSTPDLHSVSSRRVSNVGDMDPTLHDPPAARVVFMGVPRTWGIWTPRCMTRPLPHVVLNWRVTNVGDMDPTPGVSRT